MGEISLGEGRTVLFVSHNMTSITALCKSSILLANGMVECFEETPKTIDRYLNSTRNALNILNTTNAITFLKIANYPQIQQLRGDEQIILLIDFYSSTPTKFFVDFGFSKPGSSFSVHLRHEQLLDDYFLTNTQEGFRIRIEIEKCYLEAGEYEMTLYCYDPGGNTLLWIEEIPCFTIGVQNYFGRKGILSKISAPINPPFTLNKIII